MTAQLSEREVIVYRLWLRVGLRRSGGGRHVIDPQQTVLVIPPAIVFPRRRLVGDLDGVADLGTPQSVGLTVESLEMHLRDEAVVAHLNDDTGVLGEQGFYDIVILADIV